MGVFENMSEYEKMKEKANKKAETSFQKKRQIAFNLIMERREEAAKIAEKRKKERLPKEKERIETELKKLEDQHKAGQINDLAFYKKRILDRLKNRLVYAQRMVENKQKGLIEMKRKFESQYSREKAIIADLELSQANVKELVSIYQDKFYPLKKKLKKISKKKSTKKSIKKKQDPPAEKSKIVETNDKPLTEDKQPENNPESEEEEVLDVVVCPICQKAFKNEKGLKMHQNIKHPGG